MKKYLFFCSYLVINFIINGCNSNKKIFRGYIYGGQQFSSKDDSIFRSKLDIIKKNSKIIQVFNFPYITQQYPAKIYSVIYYSKNFSLSDSKDLDGKMFYSEYFSKNEIISLRDKKNQTVQSNVKIYFDDKKTYVVSDIPTLANDINNDLSSSVNGWHSVKVVTDDIFSWLFYYNLSLIQNFGNKAEMRFCIDYDEVSKLTTLTYLMNKR